MRSLSLSVELDGSLVSKYKCPPTLPVPSEYAATLALIVLAVLFAKLIVPIAASSPTDSFLDNVKVGFDPVFVCRIAPLTTLKLPFTVATPTILVLSNSV